MGIDNYKKIDRLDDYELRALDAGVDAVGEYLDGIGIYDLTLMDELNQRMIVKAAWKGRLAGCERLCRRLPSDAYEEMHKVRRIEASRRISQGKARENG